MSGGLAGAVDPDTARRVAEDVLADPRFHPDGPPRPFAGFFRRLGELVVDPVLRFFERLGEAHPGVGSGPWLVLAVAAVIAAVVLTVRLSSRREGAGSAAGRSGDGRDGTLNPAELERRADEAERRGDLESALRLRFRAGLIRLDAAGVVQLRPGLTNAAVRRVLRSPRFDELAGDFDEVAYGGRPATAADVAAARSAWPAVVQTARSTGAANR